MLNVRKRQLLYFAVPWVAICAALADDSPWLGKQAFLRQSARPKVGDRTFRWNDISMPVTITQVNGDWLWIGNAWVRSRDILPAEDAPSYYTKSIQQEPDSAYFYELRGVAWQLKREYENAIRDYSEAIRLNPTGDHLYCARAKVYSALHEYDKAGTGLNEAIRLSPDTAVYYNDRGCVYTSLDNYPKGYDNFAEAIRIDPKFRWPIPTGPSRHADKEYDKAMADFNRALELDPKLSHAYCFRGLTWCKTGHYSQALKDWDESIRLTPDEFWGYYNKARMYATCESLGHRDGELALELAKRACELAHWEEWRCVATLAAAYAELGKFDEAIRWQKKAIAMNKNPEERDRIGKKTG